MPAAGAIFISYRRSDSKVFTDRIYDYLANHFGPDAVFRDVQSIQYGERFPERLRNAVNICQVMLVVMGPTWATVTDNDGQQRLANPQDWVRLEIEGGLARDIPMIPILLAETQLPEDDQLPGELRQLKQYHCAPVRPSPDFQVDMERLTQRLEALIGSSDPDRSLRSGSEARLVRRRGRLRLSGHQRQQLRDALQSAFPQPSQLALMLEDYLDLSLNDVAGNGPYPSMIFALVKAINAQGRVEELLEGALQASNTSPELQELADLWLKP